MTPRKKKEFAAIYEQNAEFGYKMFETFGKAKTFLQVQGGKGNLYDILVYDTRRHDIKWCRGYLPQQYYEYQVKKFLRVFKPEMEEA